MSLAKISSPSSLTELAFNWTLDIAFPLDIDIEHSSKILPSSEMLIEAFKMVVIQFPTCIVTCLYFFIPFLFNPSRFPPE